MVMTGTVAGTWGASFFSMGVSARFGSLWYVRSAAIHRESGEADKRPHGSR